MSWNKWSSEGKINIDIGSPIFPYLWYLGSECGSGVYAYKSQTTQGNHREYRLLIKKVSQLGGSDDPHIIVHLNTRSHPPIQMWHYTDRENGQRIGSVEEDLFSILVAALAR